MYIYIKIYAYVFSTSNTKIANTKELQQLYKIFYFVLNREFKLLFNP